MTRNLAYVCNVIPPIEQTNFPFFKPYQMIIIGGPRVYIHFAVFHLICELSHFLIPLYMFAKRHSTFAEELLTSQWLTRESLNSISRFFLSELTNITFQMVIIKICLVHAWFLVGFMFLRLRFPCIVV